MQTSEERETVGNFRRPLRPLVVATGLAASLVFAYLAVRDVDFELFAETIADSSYWWILPSLAAMAFGVAIRVARWRSLFPPETRPPTAVSARAFFIGELMNIVLPFRTGELARVVVVHREAGVARPEVLGTVVVERLLDVLVLLLLLFAALPFVPDVAWIGAAMIFLAVVAVVMSIAIIVLRHYGARPLVLLLRPLGWLPGFSPDRASAAAENLLRGMRGLRDIRTGVTAILLTAAGWIAMALAYWLAIRGLNIDVGYEAAVLVVVTTTFSLIIPSLPAAVGVFEAATIIALQPFGIESSRALSCAVVLHVLSVVAFVCAGLVALRMHRAAVRVRAALS